MKTMENVEVTVKALRQTCLAIVVFFASMLIVGCDGGGGSSGGGGGDDLDPGGSGTVPAAAIDSPISNVAILEGESVSFAGSVTDGDAPLSYAWDLDGDGTTDSTDEDPGDISFSTAGTYTVSFTVTDNDGESDSADVTITVEVDTAPTASITSPSGSVTIIGGQSINCQGAGTGGNGSLSYLWDFNGGATNTTSEDPGSVTFLTAGTYTVTFTVTDNDGDNDSDSVNVNVVLNGTRITQSDGDWDDSTTWVSGQVPLSGDDVLIAHNVIIPSGYTIPDIDNLTIQNGAALTQNNDLPQTITGTLTIENGGTLTHGDNFDTQLYIINFTADMIDIQNGGAVNVDGLGYDGGIHDSGSGITENGYGPGGGESSGNSGAAGGAHAGNGGDGTSTLDGGGLAYCDVTNPSTIGSGGGYDSYSGTSQGPSGGGLIVFTASTVNIDGTISADGLDSGYYRNGGGAGGAVKITADIISGDPDGFTVTGGSVPNYSSFNNGGAGGGGCICLIYVSSNTINDPKTQILMHGGATDETIDYPSGEYGGAGIVYIKQSGNDGAVYSINNDFMEAVAETPQFVDLTLDSLIVKGKTIYELNDASLTLTLTSSDPFAGSSPESAIRLVEGTLNTNSAFTVSDTTFSVDFSGTSWTDTSSMDLSIGNDGILDLGGLTTASALNLNSLLVQNNGVLTHFNNISTQDHILNINATVDIQIETGGVMDVDGKGYDGGFFDSHTGLQQGYGPGGGDGSANSAASGGAHAGNGGDTWSGTEGGMAYCDVTNPITMGSGGGSGYAIGGSGGGLILLAGPNVIINGTITAAGEDGALLSGGGAGGAVKVVAYTISGTPESFTVTGGSIPSNGVTRSGGGGGGWVYFEYIDSISIDPETQISMYGGDGGNDASYPGEWGGAGIVYVNHPGGVDNDVIYAINNSTMGAASPQVASSISADSLILRDGTIYKVAGSYTFTLNNTTPFGASTANSIFRLSGGTFNSEATVTADNITLEIRQGSVWTDAGTDLTLTGGAVLDLREYTESLAFIVSNLTVQNSVITHGDNSDAQTHIVNISADTIDLQSDAEIDIAGRGYDGGVSSGDADGKGPGGGDGSSSYAGGGAHCGAGGAGYGDSGGTGGSAYADVRVPSSIGMGSGGGFAAHGEGSGGGLVILDATDTITITGVIDASGMAGKNVSDGGGAGGGVKIAAPNVNFNNGTINAQGGNMTGSSSTGGGGGGGAIYINYSSTFDDTDASYDISGGSSNGSEGCYLAE